MTSIIKHKRSTVSGKMPQAADLSDGELGLNIADAVLFMKKTISGVSSVVRVGAEMSAPVAATLKEATLPAFRAALGIPGDGQSWANFLPNRAVSATYSNATGRAILISVVASGTGAVLSVRPAGESWVEASSADGAGRLAACITIPTAHEYRLSGATAINTWVELR